MRTFQLPPTSASIGEFTYEGCRYSGIESGLSFSVLSEGLADFLLETFPNLIEASEPAPVADNEYCCSKCNKDCGSKFMKERHEKVCKVIAKGLATILKPSYIFWNYANLDKTQLTEDQLIPQSVISNPPPPQITEENIGEPAPGRKGKAMIGKSEQNVTIDREGVEWYGRGIEEDSV